MNAMCFWYSLYVSYSIRLLLFSFGSFCIMKWFYLMKHTRYKQLCYFHLNSVEKDLINPNSKRANKQSSFFQLDKWIRSMLDPKQIESKTLLFHIVSKWSSTSVDERCLKPIKHWIKSVSVVPLKEISLPPPVIDTFLIPFKRPITHTHKYTQRTREREREKYHKLREKYHKLKLSRYKTL